MKRIMFVMLKTLGDVVISTTLVRELKREYPESEIHFYTNPAYSELLSNNPDVHEVHSPDDWNYNGLFMEMAARDYDTVLAPYQVRPECNIWHQNEETRHQHLLDFYWRRMGMQRPITDRECYLYPSTQDHERAFAHISTDVPRIAIHATTGVSTKDWPYFDKLSEELRKAGYAAVQVGSRTDISVAGAVDLRGKMGLLELAAFLSKCAVFVGLDSGISYIADAMRTPTIVIQGSTNPVTSGPISKRVKHLFVKETGYADCQEIRCHSNCRQPVNCITKVSVEEVLSAIDGSLVSWKAPIPAGVE